MSDFDERLAAIARRLDDHAVAGFKPGLTDPDPGADERWEAAQVWAHMAEFIDYWREQAELIIQRFDGQPVPFGRVKTDTDRLAAIETGRRQSISELAQQTRHGMAELRRFIDGLDDRQRSAVGRHATRGDMSIERLIDFFLLDHLEEHLDQLDSLAQAAGN